NQGSVEGVGMIRSGAFMVVLLLSAGLRAQAPEVPFGLTLGKVPEALYAQMPPLPKDQGVIVEAVEPNSPAWRGGLRRFDIIMSLNSAKTPADVNALADKLKQVKSAKVTVLRAGREVLLSFDANRKDNAPDKDPLAPKSFLKP